MDPLHKLFTRYMTSAAVFTPDEPSAAQLARDMVEMNEHDNEEDENENSEGENSDANENEDENEDEENNEDEDEDEEKEDEVEKPKEKSEEKTETEDEKKARIASEKEARKEARVQKRIDAAIADAKAARTEAEELRKQLAEKPVEGLTEEEVQRRAEKIAEDKLTAKRQQDIQSAFDADCSKLESQAKKIDPKFEANLDSLVTEVGKIPGAMIGILSDLDNENGGEVLAHLVKNPDEYEDIWELTEGKMTQKLIRLSDKLKAEKRPAPRQRSNVPPPIEPVNENGNKGITKLTGKESTDDFIRIRNAQIAEREDAKRRGIR